MYRAEESGQGRTQCAWAIAKYGKHIQLWQELGGEVQEP